MTVRIEYARRALEQLEALYAYIAADASPAIAARYTRSVFDTCEGLQTFPLRGTCRDDIRPSLRITHHRKRTVIAFTVDGDRVAILGVFYGGQDYATHLHEDEIDL